MFMPCPRASLVKEYAKSTMSPSSESPHRLRTSSSISSSDISFSKADLVSSSNAFFINSRARRSVSISGLRSSVQGFISVKIALLCKSMGLRNPGLGPQGAVPLKHFKSWIIAYTEVTKVTKSTKLEPNIVKQRVELLESTLIVLMVSHVRPIFVQKLRQQQSFPDLSLLGALSKGPAKNAGCSIGGQENFPELVAFKPLITIIKHV